MLYRESNTIEQVIQKPWMIEKDGILFSETQLFIQASRHSEGWCKISVQGKAPYMETLGLLSKGMNEVTVHVTELENDGDNVAFEVFSNSSGTGVPLCAVIKPQLKVRHWKIYIAHDLHMDIGYTDYQETLRNQTFPSYLDDALRYIEETKEWDRDSKFKYPLEASYLLYGSAWHVRDADWVQKIKQAVSEGSITYPSSYAHFVMEGLGTEQTARMNYISERYLKDMLGSESSKVLIKTDCPGISWGSIDALVDAGVKFLMLRFNDPDWETSFGSRNEKYPKLFYMQGKNPTNKVLVYNGPRYALEEYKFDFLNPDSALVFQNISRNLLDAQTDDYTYDAVIQQFTTPWDNNGITPHVKDHIKALNEKRDAQGRKYVYPRVITSTTDDFFHHIETNFAGTIPTYKGTIESWWAFGPSSAAYEVGINKMNHDKLPMAEFYATMANLFVPNVKYPYENILTAYDRMLLFDEHTWSPNPLLEDNEQWNWKRNLSIVSDNLTNQILNQSLNSISSVIPTQGDTVVVFNSLSWSRTDIVFVDGSKFPKCYELIDNTNGNRIAYQKTDGNAVSFMAENVPALGYKCFRIQECHQDPVFENSLIASQDTLENRFYKVAFDVTGSVSSIIDKRNGNVEMVDATCEFPLNQFVYYNTKRCRADVLSIDAAVNSDLQSSIGAISATMTSEGITEGVSWIKRTVTLYETIPRIDIINYVNKKAAPLFYAQDEEGFFVFPFKMDNFEISHEMPTGDVKPHVSVNADDPNQEQFYKSSTDHYTVNRWIDLSDGENYGISFSPINSPLVQYGKRTSFQKKYDYNAEKPWIFSYAFNNKWHTNFPKTQPGPVELKYSIASHEGKDWKEGRVDKFGWEASNSLKSSFIHGAQEGNGFDPLRGNFLQIDKDHVVLTAMKIAEANGEGIILRFNETKGELAQVQVDLSQLQPNQVIETNIVEEDKSELKLKDGVVTFEINGYGWKTLRVLRGTMSVQVEQVSAAIREDGTQVTWDETGIAGIAYYEIFRDVNRDFLPGAGNYLSSVSVNHFYDNQVKIGLKHSYFYKIRTVTAGAKGRISEPSSTVFLNEKDVTVPSIPTNVKARALSSGRISVAWEHSTAATAVSGYKVFRNGYELKDLPAIYNSHLDLYVAGGQEIEYRVKAYDVEGNFSEASETIKVQTPKGPAFTLDISEKANITASSFIGERYEPENAADGWIGLNGFGEWASKGELNPWLEYRWDGEVSVDTIVLADRPDPAYSANTALLIFSDWSTINVPSIPCDGASIIVSFKAKTITWVKLQITGGAGANVGISEMRVYAAPSTALQGKITVSSALGADYDGFYAVNGITGIQKRNEWVSNGERNPWIHIEFDGNKAINRIVLYDLVSKEEHVNEGILDFSDGSHLAVRMIPSDGSAKEVIFPAKTVHWVKFTVTDSTGSNVGLSEFDIYEMKPAAE